MLKFLGAFGVIIAVAIVLIGVVALVFSWAWNLVVPVTFNGPVITFPAAFGLVMVLGIIGSLLFGGRGKS